MRTSRTARDAAKVAALPRRSAAASPPSALARGPGRTRRSLDPTGPVAAAAARSTADGIGGETVAAPRGSVDIEDVAGAAAAPPRATSRKRKLSAGAVGAGAEAAATPATRRSTRSARSAQAAAAVKDEEQDMDEKDDSEAAARNTAGSTRQRPDGAAPSSARRKQPRTGSAANGSVTIHAPARWEAQWDACAEMRAAITAPVDTMGCAALADKQAAPADRRFQTLVGLMLSSQTKDAITAEAMGRLHAALGAGFTAAGVAALEEDALDALIWRVGFHRTKARHIRASAALCVADRAGDIPPDGASLMALPGVGPKMAYLCVAEAWGRAEGIGVDVHVHRITNRWAWHKTPDPERTRLALQAWLPRDRWAAINPLLVGFGQTICTPLRPRCDECVLAARAICPAAPRAIVRKLKAEAEAEALGKADGGESGDGDGSGGSEGSETGREPAALLEAKLEEHAAVPGIKAEGHIDAVIKAE